MECVYYVKEREMLSIPHEMSFIPKLLRIYFNHVKNNTEIHLGMDFKEYSFIKEEMCDEGYEEDSCCAVGGFVRCNPDSYRMQTFMGRAGAS